MLSLRFRLANLYAFLALGAAAPESHRVSSLPLLDEQLRSDWFSGYLEVSGKHLHYVFIEAEEVEPSSAPLALWLNGGEK